MRIRHGYPHSPFHPLACDGIHSWIVARLCFHYINQMGQLISAYCMLSSHKILRGSLSRSLIAYVPCFFPCSFGLPFRCVCVLEIVCNCFASLAFSFSLSWCRLLCYVYFPSAADVQKFLFFLSVSVSFFCCLASLISLAFLLTREVCLMDL